MKERRPLPEYRSDVHSDPAYGLGLMLTADKPDANPLAHGGAGPGSKIAVYARVRRVAAVWTTSSSDIDSDVRVLEMLGD